MRVSGTVDQIQQSTVSTKQSYCVLISRLMALYRL